MSKPRIVLIGGGYVGLYCALELERRLKPDEAEVVLVSEENFMLYWPLLVEVGSGDLDPRHVAVPLRTMLRRAKVVAAEVTSIDPRQRCVRLAPYGGEEYELGFDHLVLGLGSLTRLMPVPRLETQLESAEGGRLELSDHTSVEADTLVWMAGVQPHPLAAESGLACDERHRLRVDACLRVEEADRVWAAGDCAAVPDLAGDGTCPPTAQHAIRQARQLARNLAGSLRGDPPEPFRYRSLGELVTLGRHKGVAEIRGLKVRGIPAWLARRVYYLTQVPSAERRARMLRLVGWIAVPSGSGTARLGGAPGRAARRHALRRHAQPATDSCFTVTFPRKREPPPPSAVTKNTTLLAPISPGRGGLVSGRPHGMAYSEAGRSAARRDRLPARHNEPNHRTIRGR